MPGPSWEDLSEFFDADEFAATAIVMNGTQEVRQILGIFDDPVIGKAAGDYMLEQPVPTFTCAETDAEGLHIRDQLSIEGKLWDLVSEPENDGTGVAILRLAKAIEAASPTLPGADDLTITRGAGGGVTVS